jgi:hypothetical protein
MSRLLALVISLFLQTTSVAYAAAEVIVQSGDTLSQIAAGHFPGESIYGARGSLARVIAANPQIANPHRIWPGQVVQLGGPAGLARHESPRRAPAHTSVVVRQASPHWSSAHLEPWAPPAPVAAAQAEIRALDLFHEAEASFAQGDAERALQLVRRSFQGSATARVPARMLEIRALARVGQAAVARQRLGELTADLAAHEDASVPPEVITAISQEIARPRR